MASTVPTYFLKSSRRLQLIADLQALSMPYTLARDYASFRDDVGFIDRNLAFHAIGLGARCHDLAEAVQRRNEQQCANLRAFLRADCIILRHYMAEVNERDLKAHLPRFNAATMRAALASEECKQMILTALAAATMQ